jgi:hypothetical protein
MNNLIDAHNIAFQQHPNICHTVVTRIDENDNENDAHKLLKKDTNEYYRVSMFQITVYPIGNTTNYENILNDNGMKLLTDTRSRYEKGEVKGTIDPYFFRYEVAGAWYKDNNSKFNTEADKECNGYLNAWNNIHIVGFHKEGNTGIQTSVCILITKDWALTRSGNVYKLGEKRVDGDIDFKSLIKN